MKIGISGASGQLGGLVIQYLKERLPAQQIVGISRTPDKVKSLGVDARFGDFDKPESLATAFTGLDRVLVIPTTDLRPGLRAVQTTTAVSKAAEAGVGRVVLMSALGTRAAKAPHLWESYFAPEQALMRVAKEWTILRMAYYAESFRDQARMELAGGVHASTSSTPVNFVSRDDLAAAAVGLLTTEGHHGAIYQGTGPASLNGEERAAAIARAAGKPFAFAQVSAARYREGLQAAALPAPVIDAVLSIQDMWATGAFNITTGDIEHLAGRRPRSVAEVLAGAFG